MLDAEKLLCHEPVDFSPYDFKSKRLKLVIVLTIVTFGVEIVAGYLTGSQALKADAWHMLTHILALSLNLLGYALASRFARDHRFHFGAGKVNSLSGYTSSLILFGVAVGMILESITRILNPVTILFRDALIVAVIGLIVNLLSARILSHEAHAHAHAHGFAHDHDHNYKAAYLHVLADALTSILAIAALAVGMLFDVRILDPLMGILGAVIIVVWAYGLFKDTGLRLLDYSGNPLLQQKILNDLSGLPNARVADFHLWPYTEDTYYLMLSLKISGSEPLTAQAVKERLKSFTELKHVTVEINGH